MRWLVLSASLASALLTAACHSDPSGDACVRSGRADTYVAGLEHTGANGLYDFKLMSATPAPPMADLNTWVIQINWEATGAPVTAAALVVTPFMPDAQQGTTAPRTQELATPGQYQISNIATSTPGYWEITIDATTPDKVEDTVVYKFCIPG